MRARDDCPTFDLDANAMQAVRALVEHPQATVVELAELMIRTYRTNVAEAEDDRCGASSR